MKGVYVSYTLLILLDFFGSIFKGEIINIVFWVSIVLGLYSAFRYNLNQYEKTVVQTQKEITKLSDVFPEVKY